MKRNSWLLLAFSFATGACLLAADAPAPDANPARPEPAAPVPTDPALAPAEPAPAIQIPPPAPAPPDTPEKETPKVESPKASENAPTPAPEAAKPDGTPATVKQSHVNVRGKASINSEVVARLQKGEPVTILEEVTLKKPKVDEPDKWAKIALPSGTAAWVHSHFVDPNNQTVNANLLNVRAGPGENYSVIGQLKRGTPVHQLETKGQWWKIQPPPDAYAFVAAHLLEKTPEKATAVAAAETTRPGGTNATAKPVETVIAENVPPAEVVDTEPKPPGTTTPPVTAQDTIEVNAPPPEATSPAPPQEEVKRIVTREGIVRRSVSIQAPTYFVLENADNGSTINYLYSPTTNVTLKDFRGQKIMVTGEELLDERWPNTPVINIDKIQPMP